MSEDDVAPGQDTGSTSEQPWEATSLLGTSDLQSDEASGAEVPADAGSPGGADDVPVFEDPNDR